MAACKHGDIACGEGYYDCDRCARERSAHAYRRLTPAQKAYDRYVDPAGAYHTDFPAGCSCHISAPCLYCTRELEEPDG